MSDFWLGALTGLGIMGGIFLALFAYAAMVVGGRADERDEPYDPEARP